MQAMVVHFCDEMVFFPYVPFIQMHMMIRYIFKSTNWDLDLN